MEPPPVAGSQSQPGASRLLGLGCALGLGVLCTLAWIQNAWSGSSAAFHVVAVGYLVGLVAAFLVTVARPLSTDRLLGAFLGSRGSVRWLLALAVALALVAWAVPILTTPFALVLLWAGVWSVDRSALVEREKLAWVVVGAVALVLRGGFVYGVPYPLASPDTPGYLAGVQEALGGGALTFDAERTPVFPLYAFAAYSLGGQVTYLLLSHALGVGVALWAGLSLRKLAGPFAGWLTFALLALTPREVEYEHRLLAEAVCVWLLTIVSVVLFATCKDEPEGWAARRPLAGAALLGVSASLAILAKPVTLPLLVLIPLTALARRWPARRLVVLGVALVLPLLAWCGHNQVRHGFFGLTQLSGVTLFGVTGHMLDLEAADDARIREEMRVAIEQHNHARPPYDPDIPFLLWDSDGPVLSSQTLQAQSPGERDATLLRLGLETLRRSPLRFMQRSAYQFAGFHGRVDGGCPSCGEVSRQGLPVAQLALLPCGAGLTSPPEGSALAYDSLVRAPARVLAGLGIYAPLYPLSASLMIFLAWRRRQDRAALIALAALALSTVAMCAVLNGATVRYTLPSLPSLSVAGAVLLSWLFVPGPAAPNQSKTPPTGGGVSNRLKKNES